MWQNVLSLIPIKKVSEQRYQVGYCVRFWLKGHYHTVTTLQSNHAAAKAIL